MNVKKAFCFHTTLTRRVLSLLELQIFNISITFDVLVHSFEKIVFCLKIFEKFKDNCFVEFILLKIYIYNYEIKHLTVKTETLKIGKLSIHSSMHTAISA